MFSNILQNILFYEWYRQIRLLMIQPKYKIKNKKARIAAYLLFFIFSGLYISAGQFGIGELRIFKVFPLVILIGIILPQKSNPINVKTIVGLVFGIGGDLVLEYGSQRYWFGVGALLFLIGHVLYNMCMLELWELNRTKTQCRRKLEILLGSSFIMSLSIINLSTTISDKMKEDNFMMVILMPVYLIFVTVGCVNILILALSIRKPSKYHLMLFIGTLLFCISDNLLGRTIFADFHILDSRKVNSFVIMVTYYLAQLMIAVNLNKIRQISQQNQDFTSTQSLISSSTNQ